MNFEFITAFVNYLVATCTFNERSKFEKRILVTKDSDFEPNYQITTETGRN